MPGGYAVREMRKMVHPDTIKNLKANRGLYDAFVGEMSRPGSLFKLATQYLNVSKEDKAYLKDVPPRMQEAMRAIVLDVVQNGGNLDIQFWPGYDFELRVAEYADEVLIHLRGPYSSPYARDSYKTPKAPKPTSAKATPRGKQAQKRRGARKGR